MSDDEYLSWWETRSNETSCRTPCGVCRTFTSTQPLLGCFKHAACKDCRYHAATCNVTSCPLCPPPPAKYDILCCGRHSTRSCPCGKEPQLLRHFLRRGAYTNYLSRDEYESHLNTMRQVEWSLMCPCGEAFDRHSACNEVSHCKTTMCGDCGAAALPGETLRVHRLQTGCVEWPTATSMAAEKERRRCHFEKECVLVQT